jgi:hypothetical protein
MIKERAWPMRVMYMLIAAALAISLIIIAAPTHKVAADPGLSEWSKVSTPSMKDWVVAPSFMITGFDGGVGVNYVIGTGYEDNDPTAAIVPQLLKSTDGSATWKDITTGLDDEIVDRDLGAIVSLVSVACDRADASFVAVAIEVTSGDLHVFISDDSGTTFRDTGKVEAGTVELPAGGVLKFVVSAEVDGMRNIAIGGTDSLAAPTTALLFRCRAIDDVGTGWENVTLYDGWDDEGEATAFTSIAVVDIQFAPSWATDNTVLVLTVLSGSTNIHLQSGTWGTIEAWNDEAGFEDAVAILSAGKTIIVYPGVAGINTPLDYTSDVTNRYVWVNLNYMDAGDPDGPNVGQIFRVKNKSVIAINQQIEGKPWLTNVSYFGYISEGKAIASLYGDGTGADTDCCEGVLVYRNDSITDMDICCLPWDVSCKPPTGRGAVVVFYAGPATAHAVALLGDTCMESAWSVSFDDGDTWNQLSLVNTWIDYLTDVAVSPDCNKTMLVSVNLECGCECDSVWLYADDLPEAPEYSGNWLRTWCGQLGDEQHGMLRLAPEETTGDTVYLVDRGTSTIYWNELETMACWKKRSSTSIIDTIVDLAVKDESTIYALDTIGAVAMSDDHGAAASWDKAVDSKVSSGWTIAVLGDDILVGGQDGDVSYSDDGGATFTELKDGLKDGLVTVAFDSYFNTNDTVYAAIFVDPTDGGVYRWVIDESTRWRDLKAEPSTFDLIGTGSTLDSNTIGFTGLVLDRPDPGNPMSSADTGGVLYASYVAQVDGDLVTGVARNLRPAAELCCEEADWDYLIQGLTPDAEAFYMMPKALKICGCLTADSNSKLFAIDGLCDTCDPVGPGYDMAKGLDGTVWGFEDCYAKAAPALTSPADDALIPADPCECFNLEVILRWDRQCDACSYDIQIALDEEFSELIGLAWTGDRDLEDYTPPRAKDPSYVIDRGDLMCDNIYYWRVRSADAETGQIIHSWWSDARSFRVAPGPNTGIVMIAPEADASDVAITDVAFTWSITASADEFDWVLSSNADLSSPKESKTGLTTTAYTSAVTLDYDATYYWQVTAYKDGGEVSKSAIGTFRTMVEPPADGVEPVTKTPVWVWVVIAIGAVLVIVVIVLIFRTRRV